jgi:hypothetical protein
MKKLEKWQLAHREVIAIVFVKSLPVPFCSE